jgi:cytochrome P450
MSTASDEMSRSPEAVLAAVDIVAEYQDVVAGEQEAGDPVALIDEARRNSPVFEGDFSRDVLGMPYSMVDYNNDRRSFTFFRYDDVSTALRNPQVFSSSVYLDTLGHTLGRTNLMFQDGVYHQRLRKVLQPAFFSRERVQEWEDRLIAPLVASLIDGFASDGHVELMGTFALDLPVLAIHRLLGLPDELLDDFHRFGVGLLNRDRMDVAAACRQMLRQMYGPVIDQRRESPGDDLVSQLLRPNEQGEALDDEELGDFLNLLIPAGSETTTRLIGNVMCHLLSAPEQLEQVMSDPDVLIPAAVEETLRLEPSSVHVYRITTEDVEVHGTVIPEGSGVLLMLSSANRDEEAWGRDASEFDVSRERRRGVQHLSFGAGPHLCLGLNLARIEARLAVEQLFDRLPNLRFDVEASRPQIVGRAQRGPRALPLEWDVA